MYDEAGVQAYTHFWARRRWANPNVRIGALGPGDASRRSLFEDMSGSESAQLTVLPAL